MWFADRDHGWLMKVLDAGMHHVYVALYRTADGGLSWETVVDPHATTDLQSCGKTGMVFMADQSGWVTYDCGGVYDVPFIDWTPDGGSTWQSVQLPPPPGDPDLFGRTIACGMHWPTMFSSASGTMVLECVRYEGDDRIEEAYLYSTSDQGQTWQSFPYPGGELRLIDANVGLALGREIHQTRDGGRTWTQISFVNWDGQFSFVDDQTGWAVARSGEEIALVSTTNGGQTWEQLDPRVAFP
jgi:photosystem II stability/assembly factor-like uncharacterized protein